MRKLFQILFYTLLVGTLVSCSPSSRSTPIPSSSDNFDQGERLGLTFEERMGVRARLTVLTAEAQAEADRVYDKYRSRELAILNEQYADELENEERELLKASYNLSEIDLSTIIDEYLHHQGVKAP